jgi:hypothetical protein
MSRRSVFLALVFIACQASPQPSPIATNASPQPSGVVELVPTQVIAIACQPFRLHARVAGLTVDLFRVTYVCVSCLGAFPPPSPGQVPPEITAQFDRIAADRFQADITFPRGGTWRIQRADVEVPNPRPTVQAIDTLGCAS